MRGNSLVIQWLGLKAITAESEGSIAGWGTKVPWAVICGQKNKICNEIYVKEVPKWCEKRDEILYLLIHFFLLQCSQIKSFNDNAFVSFNWKRSVFIPFPKKGSDKECSNCCTIARITHSSKVILKILQARFTCLLWNLYGVQETTVRTGHGTMDWFKIEKGVHQSCKLSLWLFKLYVEYTMQNTRLDEAQAGIKIVGRNINNLIYADDTTLMAEGEKEIKSLLMK